MKAADAKSAAFYILPVDIQINPCDYTSMDYATAIIMFANIGKDVIRIGWNGIKRLNMADGVDEPDEDGEPQPYMRILSNQTGERMNWTEPQMEYDTQMMDWRPVTDDEAAAFAPFKEHIIDVVPEGRVDEQVQDQAV